MPVEPPRRRIVAFVRRRTTSRTRFGRTGAPSPGSWPDRVMIDDGIADHGSAGTSAGCRHPGAWQAGGNQVGEVACWVPDTECERWWCAAGPWQQRHTTRWGLSSVMHGNRSPAGRGNSHAVGSEGPRRRPRCRVKVETGRASRSVVTLVGEPSSAAASGTERSDTAMPAVMSRRTAHCVPGSHHGSARSVASGDCWRRRIPSARRGR